MKIKVGDVVKFIDGLCPDETGALYQVAEMNGDRCLIRSLDGTPFPPVSVAMIEELELINSPQQVERFGALA